MERSKGEHTKIHGRFTISTSFTALMPSNCIYAIYLLVTRRVTDGEDPGDKACHKEGNNINI